jgi:hypothetical protein
MEGIIRKISIGHDYKNNAMHYIVGQDVLNGAYQICEILKTSDNGVRIYILKGDEIFLWKSFNENMPMSIEYNINI